MTELLTVGPRKIGMIKGIVNRCKNDKRGFVGKSKKCTFVNLKGLAIKDKGKTNM